jgi:hypothetical protein
MRLDSGRGNDLTRELCDVRCMEEPAQIWSAEALRSFCRALSSFELQLPELESTLVSLGATWDGGDPRLWARTATLLLARAGYVPQLTFPLRGYAFDRELYDKFEARAKERWFEKYGDAPF